MRTIFTVVLALSLSAPFGAFAADAAAGKAKAIAAGCVACHGEDGNGANPRVPNVPKLAGQYASFLVRALMDYKLGMRTNAMMSGFAATLTDEDRANIAAHYASQPGLRVLE